MKGKNNRGTNRNEAYVFDVRSAERGRRLQEAERKGEEILLLQRMSKILHEALYESLQRKEKRT